MGTRENRLLTSTHNLCFQIKNKKTIYTPVNPNFTIQIWYVRGSTLHRHDRMMVVKRFSTRIFPTFGSISFNILTDNFKGDKNDSLSEMYAHVYCMVFECFTRNKNTK